MEFSKPLQENVLTLLCFDTEHAPQLAGLVTASLFDGMYKDIALRALSYLHEFHEPPGSHLSDLFEKELQSNNAKGQQFRDILMDLHRHKREINAQYVLNKIEEFINIQTLKSGIIEAAEHLQHEDAGCVDAATQVLSQVVKKRAANIQSGTFLNDPGVVDIIHHIAEPAFPLGVKELDAQSLGPGRKELHVLMALTNRGKSWWLVHLGRQAILHRMKVLHISLEMSEHRVIERYVQNIFSLPRRDIRSFITKFETDRNGKISRMVLETVQHAFSLYDSKAETQLRERLQKWKNRLQYMLVKDFPTGQLTIPRLESYLESLEIKNHFVPDLVLIDYADLMRVSSTHRREDLGQIYVDLRGLAMQRNIAIATVTQSNREGLKAKDHLSEGHVGEDWSKIQTADVVISYNQTERERNFGLARLYVNKARNERVGQTIVISQNYQAGQFCLQSASMGSYWDVFERDSLTMRAHDSTSSH